MSFVCARWLDHLTVLGDWRAATTQLRVERWALDEFPLPGRFFEEVVEALYREDRFLRGTLLVNGRAARPAALAMPLLSVVRPSSLIIPPQSVLPLHDVAPSRRQRLLRYDGDRGVSLQHVGVLVGEKAHRQIWPVILRWIEDGFRSRQPGSGSKETGGSSTRISRQRASASPPGTSRR